MVQSSAIPFRNHAHRLQAHQPVKTSWFTSSGCSILIIFNCAQIVLSSSSRTGCCSSPAYDDPRRYGALVAVLLEASSTLTDEILDLHDRFVDSIFNKPRRRRDKPFHLPAKVINEKVRLYGGIEQAMLAAQKDGADPFAEIQKIVSMVDFLGRYPKRSNWRSPKISTFLASSLARVVVFNRQGDLQSQLREPAISR